jgi:Tol biopolymer transport system component
MRALPLAALLLVVASLPGFDLHGTHARAQATTGRVLASSRGQVAWIDLVAPRPTLITNFPRPDYAADVAASAGVPFAVASVVRAMSPSNAIGGDLVAIDLASGDWRTLLARLTPTESLDHPDIWRDGRSIVFQRSDLRSTVPVLGQAAPQYRSRIEQIHSDGSQPRVLVDDARYPGVAPDGARLAFVRSIDDKVGLFTYWTADNAESALVAPGQFAAMAYPRYSPDGQRIAFSAISVYLRYGASAPDLRALFAAPALAHGYPWETWIVNADGSDLRQIPDVYDDDSSIAWSPDGSQLLVFGGWGSFVVDSANGGSESIPFVSGYGSIAWLPD